MKRDMDLARKILFAIEECENQCGPDDIKIEGYSEQMISYLKIRSFQALPQRHDSAASKGLALKLHRGQVIRYIAGRVYKGRPQRITTAIEA